MLAPSCMPKRWSGLRKPGSLLLRRDPWGLSVVLRPPSLGCGSLRPEASQRPTWPGGVQCAQQSPRLPRCLSNTSHLPHLVQLPEPLPIHEATVGTKGELGKITPLLPDTQGCLTRRCPPLDDGSQFTAPPTAASQPVFWWENAGGPTEGPAFLPSCLPAGLFPSPHLCPPHPGLPLGEAPIPPSSPKRSPLPGPLWNKPR